MKCNKCGKEFLDGVFCPVCGTKFVMENMEKKDDSTRHKKKLKKNVLKYLGIVILIYIVGTLIVVTLDKEIVDDSETYVEDVNEETNEEKGEEVSKSATLNWKNAYLNYLNENGNTDYGYSLSYIDEDDIPELVIDTMISASGVELCTYDGEKIIVTPVGESLTYRLQENSFCVSGGKMDSYYDIVYKIVDGTPVEVSRGEYGALDYENLKYDESGTMIYQYSLNGKFVSENDYYALIEAFSHEDEIVWSAGGGYLYDVIEVLSHPLDITMIDPYLNDNGYMSLLNNYVIMFDGLSDDKIHFTVTYNGELIGAVSAIIINAKRAEYKNSNSQLVIKFDVDYAQLEVEGYMDSIDLTGNYQGIWG